MGGAIYQLNVKGPQDLYLTGKPEFNFIKQNYKRHVNFASQRINIQFKNQVDFGRKFEIDIPRKGDFLYKLYFKFSLPQLVKTSGNFAGWTNSLGHAIIDYVDISIGGHIVDRHFGLFLEIWDELTRQNSSEELSIGKYNHINSLQFNALNSSNYEIPLKFWFCNNIGSVLPLISLQHHSIKLLFKLKTFDECIVFDGPTPPIPVSLYNYSILSEYIFIDDSERLKYIDKEHTFLINQIQTINGQSINLSNGNGGKHRTFLNFNHPCSELIFVLREQINSDNNDWFNFAQRETNILTSLKPLIQSAKLVLDGNDRTENIDEFSLRNNRFHNSNSDKHIYVMSFCNEPEKWYPTGSLNFSLIDDPELQIQMGNNLVSPVKIFIFAKNYNIIHIKKGMFQLGFST